MKKKLNQIIEITPFNRRDTESVIRRTNSLFGTGYIFEFQLHKEVTKTSSIVLNASYKGENCGHVIGKKILTHEYFTQLQLNPICESKDAILIDQILVDQEYQNKGIGSALIEALIVHFKIENLITFAWEDQGVINGHNLNVKFGMKPQLKIPLPWKASCDNSEFKCPSRKHSCHCNGILYANFDLGLVNDTALNS